MSWRYSLGGCCCKTVRDFLYSSMAWKDHPTETYGMLTSGLDAMAAGGREDEMLSSWWTHTDLGTTWPAAGYTLVDRENIVVFYPTKGNGESGGYYISFFDTFGGSLDFVGTPDPPYIRYISKFKISTTGELTTVWTRSRADYPINLGQFAAGLEAETFGWDAEGIYCIIDPLTDVPPVDNSIVPAPSWVRYGHHKEDGNGGIVVDKFWTDSSVLFDYRTSTGQQPTAPSTKFMSVGGAWQFKLNKGSTYSLAGRHVSGNMETRNEIQVEYETASPLNDLQIGIGGYSLLYRRRLNTKYGNNVRNPTAITYAGSGVTIPANAVAGNTYSFTIERFWYGGISLGVESGVVEMANITPSEAGKMWGYFFAPCARVSHEVVSLANPTGMVMAYGMVATATRNNTSYPIADQWNANATRWTFRRIFSIGSTILKQDVYANQSLQGITDTHYDSTLWQDGSAVPTACWLLGSGEHWLVLTSDLKIHLYDITGTILWTMQCVSQASIYPHLHQSSGDYLYLRAYGISYGAQSFTSLSELPCFMIDYYKSATPTIQRMEIDLSDLDRNTGYTTAWGRVANGHQCPIGAVPEGFRKDN